MNAGEVKILYSLTGNIYKLSIDGKEYFYSWLYGTTQLECRNDRQSKLKYYYTIINIELPLNLNNPKSTIDKFLKLMLLN